MTVQAVLFWIIHRRDAILILLAAKNQKIILFSFWRRLLTYSTILLQWIRSIFKIVCDCVWLYTYLLTYLLLKSTYLLLVSFLFFCVFSLFVFFFFCKKPNPDYFFCKKILRTFLPPPNECYVVFLISKHLKKKKKGQHISKTPKQTSNQQPINNF